MLMPHICTMGSLHTLLTRGCGDSMKKHLYAVPHMMHYVADLCSAAAFNASCKSQASTGANPIE